MNCEFWADFVYAGVVPSAHLCHSSATTCSHSQNCGQCLSVLEYPLRLLWAVLVTAMQDKGSLWFSSGACGLLSLRRQIPNLDCLTQKASPNPNPTAPAPSARHLFSCHVSPQVRGWVKTLAEAAFSPKVLRFVHQKYIWVLWKPWDKSRAGSASSVFLGFWAELEARRFPLFWLQIQHFSSCSTFSKCCKCTKLLEIWGVTFSI